MSPQTHASLEREDDLLEILWECGLVLFGSRVQDEYGLETPFFIDLRCRLHENLGALEALGRALHRKIGGLIRDNDAPQQVVGIPDTATPIALATAFASRGADCPLLYGQLRKQPANYPGGSFGSGAFMGSSDPNRRITLIDDVMASGRTKLWAIEELAKHRLTVARIVVVVDRGQGGGEILEKQGYPVHALYSADQIVDYFEATARISAATAREARRHLQRRRF